MKFRLITSVVAAVLAGIAVMVFLPDLNLCIVPAALAAFFGIFIITG